ncbi:carcinine hydrolase/isopenicillin-N N-acyltransferase family protein [Chryseomicrobium palamuruense]|uniref:Carcinine hydrolase/isopenicillin-N N-acyltransferase family protein n=1 Tax=Chryseomicrobium palamuruense TaxID=682973 RepID=A0ABV8UU87_9BACL
MCTIIGTMGDNTFWLGSNSDNPWDTRTKIYVNDEYTYKFIGTKLKSPKDDLPWSSMMTRGVNEAGIAFTFSFVQRDPEIPIPEGIDFEEFGRTILGEFSTLVDIESYLKSTNMKISGNFLFADDRGTLLLAEFLPYESRFIWKKSDTMFRTNHFLELPTTTQELHPNSALRFESLQKALDKYPLLDDRKLYLVNLLKNHENDTENQQFGNSNCSHGEKGGTISSEIIDPQSRTLWYNYGSPCGSKAQLDSWGNYVPFKLDELDAGDVTTYEGKILAALEGE